MSSSLLDVNRSWIEESATEILFSIWQGMDGDFKSKYRREIWQIFESRISAAAQQTGTFSRFLSNLCKSLNAGLGLYEEGRDKIKEVVDHPLSKILLRFMREETPFVVMLVRIRHQEYVKAYEARMLAEEAKKQEGSGDNG